MGVLYRTPSSKDHDHDWLNWGGLNCVEHRYLQAKRSAKVCLFAVPGLGPGHAKSGDLLSPKATGVKVVSDTQISSTPSIIDNHNKFLKTIMEVNLVLKVLFSNSIFAN